MNQSTKNSRPPIPLAFCLDALVLQVRVHHTVLAFDEPPTLDIHGLIRFDEQRPPSGDLKPDLPRCEFRVANARSTVARVIATWWQCFLTASVSVPRPERNIFNEADPAILRLMISGLSPNYAPCSSRSSLLTTYSDTGQMGTLVTFGNRHIHVLHSFNTQSPGPAQRMGWPSQTGCRNIVNLTQYIPCDAPKTSKAKPSHASSWCIIAAQ